MDIREYLKLGRLNDTWPKPISEAVKSALHKQPNEISTTKLIIALGLDGFDDRTYQKLANDKLHDLKSKGGPLEGWFRYDTGKPTRHRTAEGGKRFAVLWSAPASKSAPADDEVTRLKARLAELEGVTTPAPAIEDWDIQGEPLGTTIGECTMCGVEGLERSVVSARWCVECELNSRPKEEK